VLIPEEVFAYPVKLIEYIRQVGVTTVRQFVNITSRVRSGGEQGLLGMAFHPGYPTDPRVFSEETLADAKIRALAKSSRVVPLPGQYHPSACRVTLKLKNGKEVSAEGHDFKGTPTMPLSRAELLEKFLKLTAHKDRAKAERLFSQLAEAEKVADFSTLDFAL
jgi:2-methylcitrate dehydratase PrpD